MAEITGDTPQAVALKLLEYVSLAEKKAVSTPGTTADKEWILTTYKECLEAVLNIRRWGAGN